MTDAERIAIEFEKLMEEAEALGIEIKISPIASEWFEGATVRGKDNQMIVLY